MKKTRILLPLTALVLAATYAFISPASAKVVVADVAVTANPMYCLFDGYCDQTSLNTCKLSAAGVTFYRMQGLVCPVAAIGKFHQ